MKAISNFKIRNISPEHLFMLSGLVVNGGNYLYNLILGRVLGPAQFADAAVLITFLLVLSFIAMTFQLVTAKFSILFSASAFASFINKVYKSSFVIGVVLGILIIFFADALQSVFNTTSSQMFVWFGLAVPFYFLMSVNRGVFQGQKDFKKLSITYQSEMIGRLLITFLLLYLFKKEPAVLVAIGIAISFVFGLIPFKIDTFFVKSKDIISKEENKKIISFFALTAFYELTQIMINNSDILLVKHYFESYDAGLYASLALIGRMVYFIAWMFVMILLPTVITLKKEGKPTAPILFKYVSTISLISFVIVFCCFVFPEQVVFLLFGDDYVSIAPLLWKYALATSLFAISNIFAYYYLSLDQYIPVLFLGLLGIAQVLLIFFFHQSLAQVVHMQIIAMFSLLIIQLLFFWIENKKQNLKKI